MSKVRTTAPMFDVVWPLGRFVTQSFDLAPPLLDLNGKTVCLLWNGVFRGNEMYDLISQELTRRFSGVRVVDWETMGNTHGANEREYVANLPQLLRQHRCDAVISAVGA